MDLNEELAEKLKFKKGKLRPRAISHLKDRSEAKNREIGSSAQRDKA